MQMTDAIRDLRCICRDVRDHVDLHAAQHLVKRKEDRLAHIAEESPTFRQDWILWRTERSHATTNVEGLESTRMVVCRNMARGGKY